MNWIHLNLWLVVLALLMPYYVKAEESERSSFHDEDEMLPSEQTADAYDVPMAQNMATAQSGRRFSRQSYAPNYNNRNVGGNAGLQFARLLPAPLISQPLDAQASSNSKQVAFADNKRNKLSDFTKPAEETLKRLTRNPDVMDQLVGQFQQMGGGMTQNVLQEVTQAAPNISESLGKAFNEAFTQTNMLAQVAPGNLDISKLTPSLSQSNLPGSLDFGQLGQAISQNFLVGTTQNLFGALTGQAAPQPVVGAASAAATDSDTVGAAAPDAETEGTPQQDADVASPAPKNPFEQLVGQSLMPGLPGISGLPGLPSLGPMSPLGPLNPLSMIGQIAPLMGMGSEISEVRVLPDNYSPYKVSPKEVDHQTISEMKLKAVLKDALSKKTIPILWFHLPNKNIEQKSPEQFEMEAKLDHFEQQVIAELKQLQELAKMANEVKRVQLQSGFQPTTSLNTKLDLHEIPIYDITLGDIERTLKDEHVIMLMQTLVQKKKDFQRHQQATTKYITDLTGTPIKRHIIPNEETLKGMEKDDMLKMMTYAYRMAALNGHDMPWIKKKISSLDEKDASKPSMTSQQSSAMARNMQMGGERQWLAEKEQQMAMEADRQRQMQKTMAQSQMMMTPQMQMQQPQAFQRQMMPIENQMSAMDMTMQQQQQPQMQQNNERQMMPQSMMMMDNFQMAQQMPMQRQQQQQQHMMQMNWAEPNLQQTQRTMAEPSTVDSINPPEQKVAQVTEIKTKTADMNTQKMLYSELTKPQSMTDGRQQTVAEKEDKTATTPSTMSETKPQMSEDEGKARFKGIDDMFGGSDLFGTKKKHPSIPPTIINYYYNAGGSRYPPSRPSPSYSYQGSYGGGYTNYPPPPPHHYQRPASNQYTYGSYRAATGDEEIAEMLEEHKQEQSKPKLMLMMVMPDNEKSNTSAPETTNQETPTEDKNKNPQKSDKDNSNKSNRLRKKRSSEYATLEPIDENSLSELRKTYKDSLKEITLNPNETPQEALMRYNAEAIREALEKANKEPMQIAAGEEGEGDEVKEDQQPAGEIEPHQHVMQQQVSKSLPQTYTVNENGQFIPLTNAPENAQYVTQPVAVAYNPSQAAAYNPNALQDGSYNNMISKYQTSGAYSGNNKFVTQNPYLAVNSPMETVSYVKDYSGVKQPYQLTNQHIIHGSDKMTKSIQYQTPQLNLNNYLSNTNDLNNNLQHLSTNGHQLRDYAVPNTKTHFPVPYLLNQNSQTEVLSSPPTRQQPMTDHYRRVRTQDLSSIDNIMALVRQQLVECCNKCKDNILQSLHDTLKQQQFEGINSKTYDTFVNKPHTLTYRKPSKDDDFEYKQWLAEMSNKGYNKNHLTKQHQQDYLKDGKLNLHIDVEQDLRHDEQNIFFKNNQSFKRETTLPITELQKDKEKIEMVTTPMENESKIEKLTEEEEDEEEEEEENEQEDNENEIVTEKQISKAFKHNNTIEKEENRTESESAKHKNNTNESTTTTEITSMTESTTQSVYALRGQFRSNKPNPKVFNIKKGKQFATYKTVNKLGNSITKSNDKENTEEKIEEILDILHDLSSNNKESLEENSSTTNSNATTTSTIKPLTASDSNVIKKSSNATEMAEKTKKSTRRKTKSRKTSPPELEITK